MPVSSLPSSAVPWMATGAAVSRPAWRERGLAPDPLVRRHR